MIQFLPSKEDFLSPGLFRTLLALAVYFDHATRFHVGRTAVFLFFCLSGYWITQMWNSKYSQTTSPYVIFMASRFWRLLPIFVTGVIFTVAAIYPLAGLERDDSWFHFLFSNLFIFGYASLNHPLIGPAWSLDIELQFYLVAPVILVLLNRIKFAVVLTIFGLAGWISFGLVGDRLLTTYLVFFLIGMHSAICPPLSKLMVKLSVLVVTLLVGALVLSPFRGAILCGANPGPLIKYNLLLNVAMAILLAPLAMMTVQQRSGAFDRMLGDLSYPIYVFHWAVVEWVSHLGGTTAERVFRIFAGLMIVCAISFLALKLVDRPLNQLRARWVDSHLA